MLLRKSPALLIANRTGPAAGRAGFTLMELLVVVAILVVLIGVATPMYLSYVERSKLRVARTSAANYARMLETYAVENGGQYPVVGDWVGVPLESIPPLDPWQQPFQWQLYPTQLADGTELMKPVVWSGGPNGAYGPDGPCSSAYQGQ